MVAVGLAQGWIFAETCLREYLGWLGLGGWKEGGRGRCKGVVKIMGVVGREEARVGDLHVERVCNKRWPAGQVGMVL